MDNKTCETCAEYDCDGNMCPQSVGIDRCTMTYMSDHVCHIPEYYVHADSLERAAFDMLGLLLGWAKVLNVLGGHPSDDMTAYPMATAKEYVDRLHELGVET